MFTPYCIVEESHPIPKLNISSNLALTSPASKSVKGFSLNCFGDTTKPHQYFEPSNSKAWQGISDVPRTASPTIHTSSLQQLPHWVQGLGKTCSAILVFFMSVLYIDRSVSSHCLLIFRLFGIGQCVYCIGRLRGG